MRLPDFPRWWWVQPALLSACFSIAHAQLPATVTFTSAQVVGSDFNFELDVPLTGGWTLESAPSLGGPWTPVALPMPGGRTFRVPLDAPQRHFRARNSQWATTVYSVNAASWLRVDLPAGFSLVANPVDNGRGNLLAHIWPAAVDGTELYHWDAPNQRWSAVSQFAWGGWSANRVWPPGTALFVRSPAAGQRLVFAGLVSGPIGMRSPLVAGWNLVGLTLGSTLNSFPFEERPGSPSAPVDGDTVHSWSQASGLYAFYTYTAGSEWQPSEPFPATGEGFWYFRAKGIPGGSPPHQLYFNNYPLAQPIAAPPGTVLEGTNWLAQLYAGTASPVAPLGSPVPFRTGLAAGYVDTSAGGLVSLPEWTTATLYVGWRFWESSGGATYETALANGAIVGQSGTVTLTVGASMIPPSLPQDAPLSWTGSSLPIAFAPRVMPDASGTPSFAFWLDGPLGQTIVLQRSSDLTTWSDFRTVSNRFAPGWQTDPLLPGTVQQYYRVKPAAP